MAGVGIRKVDACRMFTQLIQGMYPEVQKVTVRRSPVHLAGYYDIKVKRPQGFLQMTGKADAIMKDILEELSHGKVQ